jgi:hypothetical protein
MLQDFEANYFIERSGLASEIVEIPSLEVQARRVCPLVLDQKVPCFLHLLLFKIDGHNTRTALVCQPGKVPVTATSVQHLARPVLPETAQGGTITGVQIETRVKKIPDPVTNSGIRND